MTNNKEFTQALLTVEDVRKFIMDALKRDKVINAIQLREYFGITKPTLIKYIKEGLPWFGKPTRKQFVISDVKKWFIDNKIKLRKFSDI